MHSATSFAQYKKREGNMPSMFDTSTMQGELRRERFFAILHDRRRLYKVGKMYGIHIQPILCFRERTKCDRINGYFDEARIFLKLSEVDIFKKVLGDTEETHARFKIFLKDVRTCPAPVLSYVASRLEKRRELQRKLRKQK